MDRKSTLVGLVVSAIVTTLVLFLTVLIVWALGPEAIYFVWLVCIPAVFVLLILDLVLIIASLSTALHLFRLWRADEEHRLRLVRERREVELKIRKLQLLELQQRVNKHSVEARRYQLKRRRVFG